MDDANPHDDATLNVGLKSRSAFIAGNRTVDLIGCIHSDLFFQDRYLLNDIGMSIRLVRSKHAFCLMGAADATFKVKILECKLQVRKVHLSPSVFLAHAKALEVGNAKYPIRRVVCKSFTVPQGNLSVSQESLFSGQLPTRIVIGCVDNDAFNGAYNKNPFNFKHMNATQVKLYLDGQQQTMKPVSLNYTNNSSIEGFHSLFSGTGKLQKDEGNDICRGEYAQGYALYAFDLTPDMAEVDHFNLAKTGTVRLDMTFSQALANTINIIAYGEFESIIEVDKSRNVIFDYKN
jgi:hypothetical protein